MLLLKLTSKVAGFDNALDQRFVLHPLSRRYLAGLDVVVSSAKDAVVVLPPRRIPVRYQPQDQFSCILSNQSRVEVVASLFFDCRKFILLGSIIFSFFWGKSCRTPQRKIGLPLCVDEPLGLPTHPLGKYLLDARICGRLLAMVAFSIDCAEIGVVGQSRGSLFLSTPQPHVIV